VDRLSFDSDFQLRSEEGRRKRPQGLAQGIGWGLSALGLSLLGALGGLAHHPLQSIMDEGTISPRSLAVGFTKGIVGVVAKPISGYFNQNRFNMK
jgi:vacuolar protein sorting-associated protein 13B